MQVSTERKCEILKEKIEKEKTKPTEVANGAENSRRRKRIKEEKARKRVS